MATSTFTTFDDGGVSDQYGYPCFVSFVLASKRLPTTEEPKMDGCHNYCVVRFSWICKWRIDSWADVSSSAAGTCAKFYRDLAPPSSPIRAKISPVRTFSCAKTANALGTERLVRWLSFPIQRA